MPKLQMQKSGQYMITIPQHIVRILQVKKGDKIQFEVELRKGKIWLRKETEAKDLKLMEIDRP